MVLKRVCLEEIQKFGYILYIYIYITNLYISEALLTTLFTHNPANMTLDSATLDMHTYPEILGFTFNQL